MFKLTRNLPAVAFAVGCFLLPAILHAAGVFSTFPAPTAPMTGNECIPADTNLPSGQNPATQCIPSRVLMPAYQTPRNFLDNGAMAVQQRGTGSVTCAVNAALVSANYTADRWGCQQNSATGAMTAQVITTGPTPPTGFPASVKIVRPSGVVVVPACLMQAIPTTESVYLVGQTVTLSWYAQALAGLNADNGNNMQAVIVAGSGTDQGYTTAPTGTPAITPAWTNVTTVINQVVPITTQWVRYSVTTTIPATVGAAVATSEIGVQLCFTPTATGAAATDGVALTGIQLEVASTPTLFEFKQVTYDLLRAQRFFYRVTESATSATMRGSCVNLTSSISNCIVPFPVLMRAVPVMTYSTGFGIAVAAQTSMAACTANATSTTATSAASTLSVLMSCATGATGGALGTATTWGDAGGTGVINASADL